MRCEDWTVAMERHASTSHIPTFLETRQMADGHQRLCEVHTSPHDILWNCGTPRRVIAMR